MNTLLIPDETSGVELQRCSGPAQDGSCPRVAIGDILPCAGHALRPTDTATGEQTYAVSGQATLCPVTLAAALAVTPDNLLTLDRVTASAVVALSGPQRLNTATQRGQEVGVAATNAPAALVLVAGLAGLLVLGKYQAPGLDA